MDKLERPRGLIRYDSTNGLAGKPRTVVRPRVVLYTVMLVVGVVVASLAMRARTDFEAFASRLPGAPYTTEAGELRNALDLHVVNKRGERATFDVTVEAPGDIHAIVPIAHVEIDALAAKNVPLFLTMPRERFHGDVAVKVRVVRAGSGGRDEALVPVTFLGAAK
jgi:polyferredoxin